MPAAVFLAHSGNPRVMLRLGEVVLVLDGSPGTALERGGCGGIGVEHASQRARGRFFRGFVVLRDLRVTWRPGKAGRVLVGRLWTEIE
jgi:hypothetical protein